MRLRDQKSGLPNSDMNFIRQDVTKSELDFEVFLLARPNDWRNGGWGRVTVARNSQQKFTKTRGERHGDFRMA